MIRNPFTLASERRKLTRRTFGKVLGGVSVVWGAATLGKKPAMAATEAPWSIAMVPDPQYLAARCGTLYNSIMQWVVTNQASCQSGALTTNFKAVLGVGDCVNTSSSSGEKTAAATAWGILDSNSFPWATPPGNHDMSSAAPSDRTMSTQFQTGGFFASDFRATKFTGTGSTLACPGSGGGRAFWGGSIGGGADPYNYYIRLAVGHRRLLILSLEYQPSTPTLTWAKGIHDTYTDHECIVVTHSYLTDMATLGAMSDDPTWNLGGQGYNNDDGTLNQTNGLAAGGNSGYKQWNTATIGYKNWSRLTMVLCGHWIYASFHDTGHLAGGGASWYWQQQQVTSTSARLQAVQQIFYNEQDLDNGATNPCADATLDAGHLMILKFPGDGTLEGYALSVNTGKWTGALNSSPVTDPVRLFSVAYPGVPRTVLFPMPGGSSQ